MRLRKQNLALLFSLMLAAVLALPALSGLRAKVEAQNPNTADVKPKVKEPRILVPKVVTGSAPVNDNCANAISINACPFTNSQDTTGASDETNEPQSTCTLQANSVWYTVPASATRKNFTIDTCGSDFDTAIMVWQVPTATPCSFASFVPIACTDDFGGCGDGFQSQISFSTQADTTYKVQIGGFDGETGSLVVNAVCQEILCDDVVVNGMLGSGSPDHPSVSGNLTPARLFRDGIPSTCAAPKLVCPGTFGSGSFLFDAYTFTNESSNTECVTVQYRPNIGCATNAHATVYNGTFVSTNVCTNYLADVGASDDLDFSFEVAPGANFVVVISANTPGVGTGCAYQFTIVGNICEQFDFCVQDDNNPGRFIKINSTTGAYEYHDCSKGVVLTGVGTVVQQQPNEFCKIQLTHRGPDPKRPDRAINVLINRCTHRGDASIKIGTAFPVTLADADVTNNNCECPE
jgi:hypothetical protein